MTLILDEILNDKDVYQLTLMNWCWQNEKYLYLFVNDDYTILEK